MRKGAAISGYPLPIANVHSGKLGLSRTAGDWVSLINFSRYGNIQVMQHVRHFCVAQARGVILEGQMILVVDSEASQTIRVCKCSERAQLCFREGPLQFVGCFHECHGGHYTSPS